MRKNTLVLSGMRVDFRNGAVAFAYRSTQQLRYAYRLFQWLRWKPVAYLAPWLANIALRLGLRPLIKRYLFDLFCGGETLEEALKTAQNLYRYGVQVLIDYATEAQPDEQGREKAKKVFEQILQLAHNKPWVNAVALKPSALGNIDVLEKVQNHQRLTQQEQKQYDAFLERMDFLAAKAQQLKQPLYIDAEESWFQATVDEVCETLMQRYNQQAAYVYTTIQCYKKNSFSYLKTLYQRAEQKGFYLGIKLVRGAYLEKERKRARKSGYPSPVFATKKETDETYNNALAFCLERLENIGLCIATHNEESCRKAVQWMEAYQIAPDDQRVTFSQLYGMGDHLSFNLAKAGYNVLKYLPYGPIHETFPYLARRIKENSSIVKQSHLEYFLIAQELKRRRSEK